MHCCLRSSRYLLQGIKSTKKKKRKPLQQPTTYNPYYLFIHLPRTLPQPRQPSIHPSPMPRVNLPTKKHTFRRVQQDHAACDNRPGAENHLFPDVCFACVYVCRRGTSRAGTSAGGGSGIGGRGRVDTETLDTLEFEGVDLLTAAVLQDEFVHGVFDEPSRWSVVSWSALSLSCPLLLSLSLLLLCLSLTSLALLFSFGLTPQRQPNNLPPSRPLSTSQPLQLLHLLPPRPRNILYIQHLHCHVPG